MAIVASVLTTIVGAAPASAAPAGAFRALDTKALGAKPKAKQTECFKVTGRGAVRSNAAAVAVNITVTEADGKGHIRAYPKGKTMPAIATVNYARNVDTNNSGIIQVGSSGQICVYILTPAHVTVDVTGSFSSAQFAGANVRAFDSRQPGSTGMIGAQDYECIKVAGLKGVPTNAHAVAVNITVDKPTGNGFFTLYPRGQKRPGTSNLNYVRNQTIGNSALVRVGDKGEICLFTRTKAHAIVDVTGYVKANTNVVARLQPKRVYDSQRSSKLIANRPRCFSVGSAAPRAARAVFVNLAIVSPSGSGNATLHPHGSEPTITHSIHFKKGVNRSAGQMVPVASNGKICVTSTTAAHAIVDVQGHDLTGNRIQLSPAQIAIDFGLSQLGTVYVGCTAGDRYRFGENVPTKKAIYHPPGDKDWCPGQKNTHKQPVGRVGYDCSGLIWRMFKEAGIDFPHDHSAAMLQVPEVDDVETVGLEDTGKLKPGDLLVRNGHVGMYIGGKHHYVLESAGSSKRNADGSTVGTRLTKLEDYVGNKEKPYTAHRWPGFYP